MYKFTLEIHRTRVIILSARIHSLAYRRIVDNNNNKIRYTRELLLNCFRSHRRLIVCFASAVRALGTNVYHRISIQYINSHDLVLYCCFRLDSTEK